MSASISLSEIVKRGTGYLTESKSAGIGFRLRAASRNREGGMMKLGRSVLMGIAIGLAMHGSMVAAHAATGLVRIRIVNVGFIVGAGAGQGALSLGGRVYPFSVGGIGVGTIGASAVEFVGRAYNLHSPYDLAGSYSAVGAGAALVGGVRVTRLRNAKGVVLAVQGGQVGLQLNVGVSGATISMP